MTIKDFLKAKGYTYKDFSEILCMSEQYLWRISNGYANPSPAVAGKISLATNGVIKVHEIRHCTSQCEPGCACSKDIIGAFL